MDQNKVIHGAATRTQKASKQNADALVGKFYHSFDNIGSTDRQGKVEAKVAEGIYQVVEFEWFMGADNGYFLTKLDDMLNWSFYDSAEEMRGNYNDYLCHRDKILRADAKDRGIRIITKSGPL